MKSCSLIQRSNDSIHANCGLDQVGILENDFLFGYSIISKMRCDRFSKWLENIRCYSSNFARTTHRHEPFPSEFRLVQIPLGAD